MHDLKAALFVFLTLFIGAAALPGQESGIQFNLSTPGARSLGMGGAFLALADDATAAYANPAGLTNLMLGGPEVAVELRRWSYSPSYLAGGRASGAPSGVGIDTVDAPVFLEAESEESGLSFLSVAYIFPRGLTMAVYRHQLADFSNRVEHQGFFYDGGRNNPVITDLGTKIDNNGISWAYELHDVLGTKWGDSLSLGFGLSYYELDLSFARFFYDYQGLQTANADNRLSGGYYGPPDFLPDNVIGHQAIEDRQADTGTNLGFLWKLGGGRRWSLGGVYREGPDFLVRGTAAGVAGNGGVQSLIHVPDIYGIGAAYSRDEGRTKLALDYDLIRYSQRFDEYVPQSLKNRKDFRLQDAGEIHFGVEHVFLVIESQFVGTMRFGVWNEPYHDLEYLGSDPELRKLLPKGGDDTHWSAGVGLVVKEDYQIDAALDLSDRFDTVSFSVVRFF